jgi:hypothetical protein
MWQECREICPARLIFRVAGPVNREGEKKGEQTGFRLSHGPEKRKSAANRGDRPAPAAKLPPDVIRGGAGGTIRPGRLALSEHGAASLDQCVTKVRHVEADQVRRAGHKPGDRCEDGGYPVMGGVWRHGGNRIG